MGIIWNGGFMKPMNLFPTSITCSVRSDVEHQLKVIDDNTTYVSKLFPVVKKIDSTTNLLDDMQLRVFWDQTTQAMQGKPGFIESPPDDYHPFPAIEFSENALDLGLKTPHFIVKKDSTSQYYGKDRYDNFMIEPLRNFGNRFTWYNGDKAPSTSFNTFNGGDIASTPNGMHMAFMYLRAKDATEYMSDLYYSRYSDVDGTFQNPTLIEENINMAGLSGGSVSSTHPYVNMRSDPKFLYIPNTGLLLSYMGARYNYAKDTTEYFINMKLSKDDGSNWESFNELKFTPFTNEKESGTNKSLSLIEKSNPQFNMIYAENKIIIHTDFMTDRVPTLALSPGSTKINIFYSTDMGKSFKFVNTDFNKIALTNRWGTTFSNCLATTMYYDKKLSKFLIVSIVNMTDANVIPNVPFNFGILIFANRDDKLELWDMVYNENLGNQTLFDNKTDKPHIIRTWEGLPQNCVPKMNAYVDENGLCNVVLNASMMYRKSSGTSTDAFDSYADYSGDSLSTHYSFISNPIVIPIDLNFSTDSYLGQLQEATVPWRARKLGGVKDHKNDADVGNVTVLSGAGLSLFQDAIAFGYDEMGSKTNSNPDNRFSIHRMIDYKNNRWALGTDTIVGTNQENRTIVYQIPMILNRPDWSNVNFKPRKIVYFNPMRYSDSTFRGWVDAGYGKTITGAEKYVEYPPSTKKYWEAKFLRKDNNSGFGSGLAHYNDDETAFLGYRGAMWDVDSTRGAVCHFICSYDSAFFRDITSMVHMLSVPVAAQGQSNKSILSTFLGKDFIGFRSTGSANTNFFQTNAIDATRDIEVMVVSNRYNNIDTTHSHLAYVKYREQSDWTFMYSSLCDTGNSFNANAGVAFGNLLRWPNAITGDATNVIYFKYHAESWSAYEMHHRSLPSDNSLTVLPQPCMPINTYLPNGVQVAWAGQDATANAVFKIRQSDFKNSAIKLLDLRPSIFWRSMDGSATLSIDIDFGKSINFDSVSLYKHNIYGSRFFYGQENNTTDMTAFLYHEQFLPLDSSNFVSFADYETSIVDSDTLLIYSGEFTRYVKTIGDDIIGKSFQFYDDSRNKYFIKKCKYFELLDDASTYVQFENPIGDNYVSGIERNFNNIAFVGAIVQILEDKHLYVLPNSLTARYIRMDIENIETPFWGIKSGIFTNFGEVNFDGYFKIGCLSFGTFQNNENPIQNNFKTKYRSPNTIQAKTAGPGISIQVSDVIKKLSFSSEITAAEYGRGSQFEQVENFLKDIGVNRDVFYFTPRPLLYPDGLAYPFIINDVAVRESHGFNYLVTDFYMVKMTGNPSIRKSGNLASMSLQLEEVI